MKFSERPIGEIIRRKGPKAAELIDGVLCDSNERICCPGTTHELWYAARLKGKDDKLPKLIKKLEALPDL